MISNLSNEELKAQLLSSAYPSKLFNSLLLEELLTRIKNPMSQTLNVFLEKAFVGTAPTVSEAIIIAKQIANRLGYLGSVNYLITDQKNNRVSGGSIYVT